MTLEPGRGTTRTLVSSIFPTLIQLTECAVFMVVLVLPTSGQFGVGTARTTDSPPQVQAIDPLGRSTPRGTVTAFIRAVHRDDFLSAARYMEMSNKQRSKSADLARELMELMNRYFSGPLAAISDLPSGTLDDGLPLDRERIGPLKIEEERVDIILVRVNDPQAGQVWLISSETLSQIPALYDAIQESWIEREMPRLLLDYDFLGVPLAKWAAWVVSIGPPLLGAWLLSWGAILLMRRFVAEPTRIRVLNGWYDGLHWPLIFVVTLTVHFLVLPRLGLSLGFRIVYNRFLAILMVIAVTWLLKRVSKLCFEHARNLMERRGETETESLMLLGERVLGVLLTLGAIFSILTAVGVNTKTALAGVGIGGVAVAFGAQKTVENLLGGIFLLTDKVIAVGDTCCISNRQGTIEDITLRSVRLRTVEQTLLSIPAGVLSQANIENFATRRKILAQTNLQLRYGTTAEQLRSVIDGIHKLLMENPKVETATARIRLINFGARAIELELYAYVMTSDYMEFLAVREDLLLRIAEIVESSGSGFAGPTELVFAELNGVNPRRQASGRTGAPQGEVKGMAKVAI